MDTPPSTSSGTSRRRISNQVQRVLHACVVAPVGRIDVGLDRSAVKGAVRKAVDDGDVETFAVEKRPEVGEMTAVQQRARFAG